MIRRLTLGLALAVMALAAGTAPGLAAAPTADELESSQLRIQNQAVTVYTLRGQSYRLVEVDNLADAALDGQMVCVEGKLREVKMSEFRMHGSDKRMQMGLGEPLQGMAAGDNVWIGGKTTTGGFTALVAIKLKGDLALFEERFTAVSKEKNWEKCLELASWINRSASYNTSVVPEELRRYRACRDRAVAAARETAESAFKDTDAAGYSRLASKLLDQGVDKEIVWRYYQRAAMIDPEQELAARRLGEAGYLHWHGLWLPRDEKIARETEENTRLKQAAARRAVYRDQRAGEAASGAAASAREIAELESALATRPAAEAAAWLATAIERAASSRVGRRAVFLVAGLPVRLQNVPLSAAIKSADAEIRLAALELAAARGDSAGRKLIASAASGDSSDEVTSAACQLLFASGDVESMGLLVELTGSDKDFRARAAVEALQKNAGQNDRWTPVEWRLWWSRNKAAFPAAPKDAE